MNDQTQAVEAAEEAVKTVIRPDLKRYIRDKSGKGKRTHRTDDFVARTLAGKEIDAVLQGATLLGIDHAKWAHLNVGQQRMLVGNALRHLLADAKNPLTEQAVTDVYGEPVAPYDASADADPAPSADPEEGGEASEPAQEEAPKAKKRVSKK